MSTEPVARDVWRITTPLPFRPRDVNAFLIRMDGGGFLLVDGGIGTEDAWDVLDAGVRGIAGGWSEVASHVVTHMHLDHLGLARRVVRSGGAAPIMGRLDAERSRHAEAEPAEEAEYRERMLAENGAPPEVIREVQAGRARAAALSAFVEPAAELDGQGDALPGAHGWNWVWSPGHTAGHVSLFRPADRLLIAGDAVLARITPTIGVNRQRADPVGDYLVALDRLESLRPALALPGHGGTIADPAQRLGELRDATRAEGRMLLAHLGPEPRSAWRIAALRHPDPALPAATRMLALRETRAHLDHLVEEGGAVAVEVKGGWGFVRATAAP